MEKPNLSKIGMNVAEETAKMVIKEMVRPYAEWYIAQSANKIDDILLPFMDQLEKALIEAADMIDGEEG